MPVTQPTSRSTLPECCEPLSSKSPSTQTSPSLSRGTAPETLQYNGRIWAATHHRLHRPMARNGYQYMLLQPLEASPEHS